MILSLDDIAAAIRVATIPGSVPVDAGPLVCRGYARHPDAVAIIEAVRAERARR
jgi:hypothetical protein